VNRTFVCVETKGLFAGRLAAAAAAEGDRLLLVTNSRVPPDSSGDVASLRLDVRGDTGEVAAAIRARCDDAPPAAVFTNEEIYVTAAAAVAEALGVARNPVEAVAAARDKARMKEVWRAAGVSTPSGRHLRSRADLELARFSYPVVVKPTLGFASCGVRRVDSEDELREQLRRIGLFNATVVAKEGASRGGFLVEQCLKGPEYAVDTVWFDGDPVCDLVLSRDWEEEQTSPYYPDRLYLLDPALPEERRRTVLELTHRAVRALGVSFGPTHTEVRFHDGTPYVLEAAARPGAGGLFYLLPEQAYGADFPRAVYLSQVCADRAEFDERLGPTEQRAVPPDTSYFLYNVPHKGSGEVKEIIGLDRLGDRTEVLVCLCVKEPGDRLHPRGDLNSDYFCHVVARHVDQPGGPTVEALMETYDGMVDVVYR
jgi:hypothetical protein